MAKTREWLPATLLALAGVLLAGPVAAQETVYEYTAVLQSKPIREGTVNAGGIDWKCDSKSCFAKGPWAAPGVGACAALAREVGPLASYGRPGRLLDANEMAECNRSASKPGAAPAASKPGAPAAPPPGPTAGRIEGRVGGGRDDDHDSHGVDDCDDRDPRRFPGNPEVADESGHDEDCDPLTFGAVDADGDGHHDARYFNQPPGSRSPTSGGTDCDDNRADVHPAQAEVCNHRDDNCDGRIDEEVELQAWRDQDHDLFGDPRATDTICPHNLGPGWVTNDYDCDDRDARKNPFFGSCG